MNSSFGSTPPTRQRPLRLRDPEVFTDSFATGWHHFLEIFWIIWRKVSKFNLPNLRKQKNGETKDRKKTSTGKQPLTQQFPPTVSPQIPATVALKKLLHYFFQWSLLFIEEILHQLRLVVFPIIYKVLYIPLEFLPSTVASTISIFALWDPKNRPTPLRFSKNLGCPTPMSSG